MKIENLKIKTPGIKIETIENRGTFSVSCVLENLVDKKEESGDIHFYLNDNDFVFGVDGTDFEILENFTDEDIISLFDNDFFEDIKEYFQNLEKIETIQKENLELIEIIKNK